MLQKVLRIFEYHSFLEHSALLQQDERRQLHSRCPPCHSRLADSVSRARAYTLVSFMYFAFLYPSIHPNFQPQKKWMAGKQPSDGFLAAKNCTTEIICSSGLKTLDANRRAIMMSFLQQQDIIILSSDETWNDHLQASK